MLCDDKLRKNWTCHCSFVKIKHAQFHTITPLFAEKYKILNSFVYVSSGRKYTVTAQWSPLCPGKR